MQTKYITRDMLEELFENDSYYYLEGTCPELMKFPRLIEYANNIIKNNIKIDVKLGTGEVVNLEQAKQVIEWFGEELFEVALPPNSILFIKE